MSAEKDSAEHDTAEKKEVVIKCRRTGQAYDLSTCSRCPYCFGDNSEAATADRSTFCDFHPRRDPVHFGFPGGDSRSQRG